MTKSWMVLLWLVHWIVSRKSAVGLDPSELDCRMRAFSLSYAQYIHPWRSEDDPVFQQVRDALRLDELCLTTLYSSQGIATTDLDIQTNAKRRALKENGKESIGCSTTHCIYVVKNASQKQVDGSVLSSTEALKRSRRLNDPYNTTIVFQKGVHFVESTILLGPEDSGLTVIGESGAIVSGALALPNTLKWHRDPSMNTNVRVANLTDLLRGYSIPKVQSLFSPSKRLIRARFPNGDPEINLWGYKSPTQKKHSIDADEVLEWHRPEPGPIPTFEYVDFRYDQIPAKNDSTMEMYNVYTSGTGGVCSDLWGETEPSYWCSNASAGGWAEVDKECATTGQLQIPVGMDYNQSTAVGQRLAKWSNAAIGAIVHAWHSQSWAMHMFEIVQSSGGNFSFALGGGKQGGRNWCRCDQCTYAGRWCGQHKSPPDTTDNRLISGSWMVENTLAELDAPGEFYFDTTTNLLYVYPNRTGSLLDDEMDGLSDLSFALLETLVHLKGAKNITLSGLEFSHSAATYMSDWSVPSGGDWAIHRGGSIFLEDSKDILIRDCVFRRLDGNAVFLSRHTKRVQILRNVFEWLGESAVALWGQTEGANATALEVPMKTTIQGNLMREIGIFQKQSSGVFISKAALTNIMDNIIFNVPRAAINFNDIVGGGDKVRHNVIFNSCRESGDHGPINSWDRQPFYTALKNGSPSFEPLTRKISSNLIFANYGASQGVDNDDGSSWFHIANNVFYTADGFKMDYGGHDSVFKDNLVIGYPGKGTCVGFGTFFPGHGHVVKRNKCIVANNRQPSVQLSRCGKTGSAILRDNQYFAPNASMTGRCGFANEPIPFQEMQSQFGVEKGSTLQETPDNVNEIMAWALETLFPENIPAHSMIV